MVVEQRSALTDPNTHPKVYEESQNEGYIDNPDFDEVDFYSKLRKSIEVETPKDWVSRRQIRGGGSANYVSVQKCILKLNEVFGYLWSFEVGKSFIEQNHVVVEGRLTAIIPAETIIKPDGTRIERPQVTITKVQYGGSDAKKYVEANKGYIDLADDYKSACSDALKKCATLFGIFHDVYDGSGIGGESRAGAQQLESLKLRWNKLGKSEEELDAWVLEQTKKKKESLTAMEIMTLIGKVIDLGKEAEKK